MADHQPARLTTCLVLLVALAGCSRETEKRPAPAPAGEPPPVAAVMSVDDWHVNHRVAAQQGIDALAAATRTFLSKPGPDSRAAWQQAWVQAHENYLAMSFIVPDQERWQLIDPWPVMPGFIDSLPAYPDSGIVSDDTLSMTAATIRAQHQITDDSEVALGFHVIEYYAFERPPEDFSGEQEDVVRRRKLVDIVIDELEDDVRDHITASRLTVPAMRLPSLVTLLASRSRDIAAEYDLPGEHGEWSGRSSNIIHLQLTLMQSLLGDDVGLAHYLVDLDAGRAKTLKRTFEEIMHLETGNEGDHQQVTLLLAGLTHQLQDMASLIRE